MGLWPYLIMAALIGGLATGTIAYRKGHNFSWWWLTGTLLFVVALPYALFMAPNTRELEKRQVSSGLFKKCPYCARAIEVDARDCQYCGRNVAVLEKR